MTKYGITFCSYRTLFSSKVLPLKDVSVYNFVRSQAGGNIQIDIYDNNKQIFAYTRQLDTQKLLVVLNFSETQAALNTDIDVTKSKILIRNYQQPSCNNLYKPYEAVIYEIEQ